MLKHHNIYIYIYNINYIINFLKTLSSIFTMLRLILFNYKSDGQYVHILNKIQFKNKINLLLNPP